MLLGHPVKAIPDALRQPGSGEKEQLDAREESLAQLGILLQCVDQLLPALGHSQVSGRRNFLEVAQGLGEALCGRLAVVQIERAAVVQHDTDVVTAAEGVVPGQPVDQHGRLFAEHRERLQQHLLIGTQHALGSHHRLGQFGRARGEQKLGDGVGAAGQKSCLGLAAARLFEQAGEAQLMPAVELSAYSDDRRVRRNDGINGTLKRRGITDKYQPWPQYVTDVS